MKKLLVSILLLLSTFSLTSCKVNWFGSSFDAPWYFVAIPVLVIIIAVYWAIISGTYICPQCKSEFKPKWYQISACLHLNGERLVKCPNCGRKGFCKRKK